MVVMLTIVLEPGVGCGLDRFEYRPTPAGLELEPVLMTLMAWGDRHLRTADDRPMAVEHSCGNELVPTVTCATCGDRIHTRISATRRPRGGRWRDRRRHSRAVGAAGLR
jgi:hypothetical protein